MGEHMGLKTSMALLGIGLFFPLVLAQNSPWDVLRPVANTADAFVLPIEVVALVIAFGLFAVAFLAYRRQRSRRFLFLLAAFGLFALKWVILIADEFVSPGNFISRASAAVIDVLVLLLLFSALFQSA